MLNYEVAVNSGGILVLTRKHIEELEAKNLAPYAMKSKDSAGRPLDSSEAEHGFRSRFQRDRDRIVHCNAFRRLEYKTQVFVVHESDYYRTRLTHTMEVSQIARSLARNLMLNEDLTEAIALAHDLGHTPFGHSGEEKLNELMKAHGGFEHNKQSLRIVTKLEERYPGFPGLNLTYEVLEGIDKHRTDYDNSGSKLFKSRFPTLEAQLVNLADEIAYNTHDLDDGIKSDLLKIEQLKGLSICSSIYKDYENEKPEIRRYQIVRELVNKFSTDLITQTTKNIEELKLKSVDNARKAKIAAVSFSKKLTEQKNELKHFLYENLYKHYRVVRMETKHQRLLEDLFKVYMERFEHNPAKDKYSILPREIWEKAKTESKEQVVCDHIASMTDRYAIGEHKKLFEASERV